MLTLAKLYDVKALTKAPEICLKALTYSLQTCITLLPGLAGYGTNRMVVRQPYKNPRANPSWPVTLRDLPCHALPLSKPYRRPSPATSL